MPKVLAILKTLAECHAPFPLIHGAIILLKMVKDIGQSEMFCTETF